jgi:hypothetical protein
MHALLDFFAMFAFCHRNIKLALQVEPELVGWLVGAPLQAV